MSEAIFGFIGVLVGAVIPWLRELWVEKRSTTKNTRYLAVRTVCVLDQYTEKCAEVVYDSGEPDREQHLTPRVETPDAPALPTDVDWRSINQRLMYELLSLPGDAEAANNLIRFQFSEVAEPPDYEEGFEERQYQYACLGLRASRLARILRTDFEIPPRVFEGSNTVEHLERKKKAIEDARTVPAARTDQIDIPSETDTD